MRKLFFVILAIGAGAGLLVAATAKSGWGAGVVMMGMGLLVAAPVWLWARKDTVEFQRCGAHNLARRTPSQTRVIEHQLAHKATDALGMAYNRTKFLKERKAMMQTLADYWIS